RSRPGRCGRGSLKTGSLAGCRAARRLSPSVQVDTQTMTTGVAAIAIAAAAIAGYYFAQWRRSEGSLRSAKTLAKGAGKAVRKARRNMLLTGLAIAAVIYLWTHGNRSARGSRAVLPVGGPGGRQVR